MMLRTDEDRLLSVFVDCCDHNRGSANLKYGTASRGSYKQRRSCVRRTSNPRTPVLYPPCIVAARSQCIKVIRQSLIEVEVGCWRLEVVNDDEPTDRKMDDSPV